MRIRCESLRGLERLKATSTVLQRARFSEPRKAMWEAADIQWWWRRPRPTDELALPVWFDDEGPVTAGGLTAWENAWQVHVFGATTVVPRAEVWEATLAACAEHHLGELELLVYDDDVEMIELAQHSGFILSEELSGTSWLDADRRPPVSTVGGFLVVDRTDRSDQPRPMIARNGELVEERLQQRSLYDPSLDLAVEDVDGAVAGCALFWFDPITLVGLVEPMRVADHYQRKGLARVLLTNGLDRLARKGARRLKVGFSSENGRSLYLNSGMIQTSVDRLLTRAAPPAQT